MKQLLNDSELAAFSGQLAMILHSGISTLEGILILRDDMEPGEGKEILSAVYESLEETGDLSVSLRASGIYPEYFLKMTEIGERSGTLEDVLTALSEYYERQDMLTRSIRDALTYPLILITMLFAVLIVLMSQVMPVFEQVFQQLGMEAAGITRTVFHAGAIMQSGSAVILAIFIIIVFLGLASWRVASLRRSFVRILGKLPFMKKANRAQECSRFSNALALALHSGLDMGESFELAAGLSTLPEFKSGLEKAAALMENGSELSNALQESGIFTGLNARMVSLGFRTGSAETVLQKISVSCQEDADTRVASFVNGVEPTITAVLSILTGLILVSVMLPLLSVMSSIG